MASTVDNELNLLIHWDKEISGSLKETERETNKEKVRSTKNLKTNIVLTRKCTKNLILLG